MFVGEWCRQARETFGIETKDSETELTTDREHIVTTGKIGFDLQSSFCIDSIMNRIFTTKGSEISVKP